MEEEDGRISIAVINPKEIFSLVDNPGLAPVAEEVEAKMLRVLDKLG